MTRASKNLVLILIMLGFIAIIIAICFYFTSPQYNTTFEYDDTTKQLVFIPKKNFELVSYESQHGYIMQASSDSMFQFKFISMGTEQLKIYFINSYGQKDYETFEINNATSGLLIIIRKDNFNFDVETTIFAYNYN